VWFDGGWRDTNIWARLDLPLGARISGPAILEQADATTVIEPEFTGRIDPIGNLVVEPS
jgi:N-methylhydantoinase A